VKYVLKVSVGDITWVWNRWNYPILGGAFTPCLSNTNIPASNDNSFHTCQN